MNELAYRAAERRLWEAVGARPIERRIHLDRIGVDVRIQEVGEGPPVLSKMTAFLRRDGERSAARDRIAAIA